MHDRGLRQGEVVALDLADLEAGTVAIAGQSRQLFDKIREYEIPT